MRCVRIVLGVCGLVLASGCLAPGYDIVVYGGTSAGVIAAVQGARLGHRVLLIEPTAHLGGMSASGLGNTDTGQREAIGGLAREFYRRVGRRYGKPEVWRFEPHVAEEVFDALVREAGIDLWRRERLDLRRGIRMRGSRITRVRMESGRTAAGRVFIDATYEGDLMALAGVSYVVGRESNARYGETLNGVQTAQAVHHQFIRPVDPYVVPGDPSSGLLPGIEPAPPPSDGTGDHRIQAYCLRLCTTDDPANRRPWPKPADYDAHRYELLLRNFEAGDQRVPWYPVLVANRKTDTNNNHAVSTDYIGMNYAYPEGDYATRARIRSEHLSYTKGLMWTLAHHPRVPPAVRRHFQRWGLARDEFTDHDNWPYQLYVREARRMVSDYVITQHDCQGRVRASDPVGLASYNMDSHNVQRYVDPTGHVRNEGDVQVPVPAPFGLSYRAIRPRRGQCTNLLVPVCLSASHIAYGSIRMEPVFMILGQSSAVAASLAIRLDCDIQDVPYGPLAAQLRAAGQRLDWPP